MGLIVKQFNCILQYLRKQLNFALSRCLDKAFAIRLAMMDRIIGSDIIVVIIMQIVGINKLSCKVKSRWDSGIRITVQLYV